MNMQIIGLFGFLLMFIIVGNYAGKKVQNLEDYYVSGRNCGTFLLTGTLVASMMSTVFWTGDAGFVYDGWLILNLMFIVLQAQGHPYGVLFYGRYLRRSEAVTVSEYFGKRFKTRRMQTVVAVVTIAVCFAYMVSVTQGINVIFSHVTGIDYKLCLVLTWAVYTSFTVFSGSKGVILTDTIMFIIFFAVAVIMFPFVIDSAVGEFSIQEVFRELANFGEKPGVTAWHGLLSDDWLSTPMEALVWQVLVGIAWLFAIMVSPWQSGRHLMAKNEHTSLRTGAVACILCMFMQVFVFVAATSINLVKPDIVPSENVMIYASENMMPAIIGVVLLAGIVSAGLSSTSTFLSIMGFAVVNDIMQHKGEGKEALKFNRTVMLIVGVVVLVINLFMPLNVFWIAVFAGTTITAALAVASIGSVWSKTMTEKAAFWSIITGFAIKAGLTLFSNMGMISLPVWMDSFFPALIGSLIVAIVVSKFTTVTDGEREYREQLHILPESEKNPAEMKRTMKYGYLMIGFGVFYTALLLYFWALPHNGII